VVSLEIVYITVETYGQQATYPVCTDGWQSVDVSWLWAPSTFVRLDGDLAWAGEETPPKVRAGELRLDRTVHAGGWICITPPCVKRHARELYAGAQDASCKALRFTTPAR